MPKRATVPLACGKSVTFSGKLRMKDFRAWTAAEQANDYDACYGYLAQLIEAWEFDGDPSDPAAYDELDLSEYQQLNKAAAAFLTDEGTAKN